MTVNNYLAVGGDGFTVLKDGTAQRFGVYDVDALYAYFQANSPIAPASRRPHRAIELKCKAHMRRTALSERPANPVS